MALPTSSITASSPFDPASIILPKSEAAIDLKKEGDSYLNDKNFNEAIGTYTKVLQLAELQNNKRLIIECLKDLAKVYLEKKQWSLCAQILNGALALFQKENLQDEPLKNSIFFLLSEVERIYLEKEWDRKQPISSDNLANFTRILFDRREKLQNIRQEIQLQINQNRFPSEILASFSQSIILFLEDIVKSGNASIPPPPCNFSFIGLGSLARNEMSPYSDLEFAILLKKLTYENKNYFNKLVLWLELQIINLGETAINILEGGRKSPVNRGFSFDSGGNTPFGKKGIVDLLNTPKNLAHLQSDEFYEQDLILSNILKCSSNLLGDKSLHHKYEKAINVILSSPSKKPPLTIGQNRVLDILKGHLIEFEPRIDKKKEKTPVFNVKAELYRLPNFLIAALADYFGIKQRNTWERLDKLAKKKILHPEGVKNLKEAMNAIMSLRIRCHLYYLQEQDEAFHPSMKFKEREIHGLNNVFVLSDADIDKIVKIYRVILPLHRAFKKSVQTKEFSNLSKEIFFDSGLEAQGDAYERLQYYSEAKKCYHQMLAMDPNNIETLIKISSLLRKTAEYDESQEYITKALAVAKKISDQEMTYKVQIEQGLLYHDLGKNEEAIKIYKLILEKYKKQFGENSPEVARCLHNLGSAWQDLGLNVLNLLEKTLQIRITSQGEKHPDVAATLNNLGNEWRFLGNYKKAIELYKKAIKIGIDCMGENHPDVATYWHNLGVSYQELGNRKKAIKYHEKALTILRNKFGNEHPSSAKCLSALGLAYKEIGKPQQALKCYEEALAIRKKIYLNQEHPDIAGSLSDLGSIMLTLGEAKKSLEFCTQASEIYKKCYPSGHIDLTICESAIGSAWLALGNPEKAIEYYKKDFKFKKKNVSHDHPSLASCLSNIGVAHSDLRNYKKAHKYYKKALVVSSIHLRKNHPLTATIYHNLGSACRSLGLQDEAFKNYEKALKIRRKIFDSNHPDIAATLQNMGISYEESDKVEQAFECYNQALGILTKALGNDHPSVATCLSNLGSALKKTGKLGDSLASHSEALRIRRKSYGNDHPDVAVSLHNCGSVLLALAKNTEAIQHIQEAIDILKKNNENHPLIPICINSLGIAYKVLKKWNQAIECFQDSLTRYTNIFGREYAKVMTCNRDLGICCRELQKHDEAKVYFEEELKLCRKINQNKPLVIAKCLFDLGVYHCSLKQFDMAIKYFDEDLKLSKTVYGDFHTELISTLNNMVYCWEQLKNLDKTLNYYEEILVILRKFPEFKLLAEDRLLCLMGSTAHSLGNAEKAIKYYEEALKIYRAKDDKDQIAECLNNLGIAYKATGKREHALECLQEAISIKRIIFGNDNPKTADSLYNLGTTLNNFGEANQALEALEEAMIINWQNYGNPSAQVGTCVNGIVDVWNKIGSSTSIEYYTNKFNATKEIDSNNIGKLCFYAMYCMWVLNKLGEKEKSLEIFEEGLIYYKKLKGENYPELLDHLREIANGWQELGNLRKAVIFFERALVIKKIRFGSENPIIGSSLNVIGSLWRDLNEHETALKYYEEALQIQRKFDHKVHGKDDSGVSICLNFLGHASAAVGRKEQALNYFQQDLEILRRKYGENDSRVQERLKLLKEL